MRMEWPPPPRIVTPLAPAAAASSDSTAKSLGIHRVPFREPRSSPVLRRAMIHSIGVIADERCHAVSRDYQTCRGQGRKCCFPALFSSLEKADEVHAVSLSRCSSRRKFQDAFVPPAEVGCPHRSVAAGSNVPSRATKGMSILANAGESRGDSGTGR